MTANAIFLNSTWSPDQGRRRGLVALTGCPARRAASDRLVKARWNDPDVSLIDATARKQLAQDSQPNRKLPPVRPRSRDTEFHFCPDTRLAPNDDLAARHLGPLMHSAKPEVPLPLS